MFLILASYANILIPKDKRIHQPFTNPTLILNSGLASPLPGPLTNVILMTQKSIKNELVLTFNIRLELSSIALLLVVQEISYLESILKLISNI